MNEAGARTCGGARATRATSAAFVGAPTDIDDDRVQGGAGGGGRCRGWTSAKLPARAVALPTRATAHERRPSRCCRRKRTNIDGEESAFPLGSGFKTSREGVRGSTNHDTRETPAGNRSAERGDCELPLKIPFLVLSLSFFISLSFFSIHIP